MGRTTWATVGVSLFAMLLAVTITASPDDGAAQHDIPLARDSPAASSAVADRLSHIRATWELPVEAQTPGPVPEPPFPPTTPSPPPVPVEVDPRPARESVASQGGGGSSEGVEAAPTATEPSAPPRSATLLFTGDISTHAGVVRAASLAGGGPLDFSAMFAEVAPRIAAADLAICHMESPVSDTDGDRGAYPLFNAPRSILDAIAGAGYDGCSVASNHAFDRKSAGVHTTVAMFEAAGLRPAGMARTPEEDVAPVVYDAGGIMVGHVAATYWLNGFKLPDDEQHLVDLIEPDLILEEAALARASGAEFVVVSLHWGAEYVVDPTAEQLAWLEEILPSPHVDLIVGHHSHVPQPVDRVGGEWVVFGIGNFLTGQSASCCPAATQDGVIVEIELMETDAGTVIVEGITYTPTYVRRPDYVILPVPDWLGRADVAGSLRTALERSLARTQSVLESRYGPSDGLVLSEPFGR